MNRGRRHAACSGQSSNRPVLAVLVNGADCIDPSRAISVSDRGLCYGDGLFETMLVRGSNVRFLNAHLERLTDGCRRLRIDYPGDSLLRSEIASVCGAVESGILKLVLTRGSGSRGYRAASGASATRILSLHPPLATADTSLRVRWCDMRLSRNVALAGLKHLNRLEQVLAQSEWDDPAIGEGLMLDNEGELVCATSSNLFLVRGHELVTSDLRYCGIHGVMRTNVIKLARSLGITVHEEPVWPNDLETASEVFVTNAVRGIRSVTALENRTWDIGPITQSLQRALETHA
jgi:4-amino-4-deoxychorismate lyase